MMAIALSSEEYLCFYVRVACSKWLSRHTQRCLLEWFTFQYIETFPFSNESRVAVHYINNSNGERIMGK